ncbi:hypothetical protein NPX98_00235 [Bartonella sp. A5(2022)]|nr:hypothetical protein [Bartonella sp. A05]
MQNRKNFLIKALRDVNDDKMRELRCDRLFQLTTAFYIIYLALVDCCWINFHFNKYTIENINVSR